MNWNFTCSRSNYLRFRFAFRFLVELFSLKSFWRFSEKKGGGQRYIFFLKIPLFLRFQHEEWIVDSSWSVFIEDWGLLYLIKIVL
jgi:hypothetical protein